MKNVNLMYDRILSNLIEYLKKSNKKCYFDRILA